MDPLVSSKVQCPMSLPRLDSIVALIPRPPDMSGVEFSSKCSKGYQMTRLSSAVRLGRKVNDRDDAEVFLLKASSPAPFGTDIVIMEGWVSGIMSKV